MGQEPASLSLAVPDHGIEHDDELSHDGGDVDLEGLAASAQAACEGLEHGIATERGERVPTL